MNEIIGYGGGGKGGDGGGGAVEAPDTLHSTSYAKLLDLVSEGEIYGLVDGLKSVYFNKTPVQNSDNSFNFTDVTLDVRTGTQNQDIIAGFPSVENETAVGIELTSTTPYTQSYSNLQLTALRVRLSVPQLSQANTTNGDINGYKVAYNISLSVDGGAYAVVVDTSFNGKTTTEYQRSHRINLPKATTGWAIRITRTTPNAHSSSIADTTSIVSITTVIDAKLRYPNSAIIGTQIDAKQFSGIPQRAFHLKGRIIKVPDNYDPVARTYTGVWTGNFKPAYTNNPAWIFYDLVLNDRYGLGNRINASQVDKWGLYQIGVYCDVLVPDGFGGMEPRMTCNAYLQQQADAYKVLQDLATVFRGMAYWASGQIVANADMPTDPVHTYTGADVLDGKFSYVGSPWKTRYTVAQVTWNDPQNFYAPTVETVQDQEGISRYGIQLTSITAFGCSSQGQAQRLGLWTTLTSRLEMQTIMFSVGMEGAICLPGEIIRVADVNRMGRRNGGRLRSVTNTSTVVVDKAPTINVGDPFTVTLPTGYTETKFVLSVSGNSVTMSAPFSQLPVAQSIWTVDNTDLTAPTYKVISVTEKDDMTFEITALQHEPGKFANIDSGAPIDVPPHTVIPPSVQVPPTGVVLSTYNVLDQGIQGTNMLIAWQPAANAVSYVVEWQRGNNNWVTLQQTGLNSAEVVGVYAGDYLARVRAINPLGVKSAPAYSVLTTLTGKTSPPPVITSLVTTSLVFGIKIDWVIPSGATDTQRTELWISPNPTFASATKLSDLAYPQQSYTMMGLSAGASFFFWARLVDRSGNVGDYYPVTTGAGVNGQSSSSATEILSYLAGQIGNTQLAQEVLKPIQQIPVIINRLDNDSDALATSTLKTSIANDQATATAKTVLQAQVDNNLSLITSESTARANADSALSTRVDTVAAQTNTNAANIVTETTARTDGDSALASSISTVSAQTGTNTANISTNATAISNTNGSLSAMYSIKTQITTDGRTYFAGIGLGVSNSTGILESQVLVAADRFAVINGTGAGAGVTSPFVVQGGQTFINQAVIGNAWITNAMIGDTIQSTALGFTGQPLWKLSKTGGLTFTSSASGGGMTQDANGIKVYDGAGTLRVQLGNLA